MSELPKGWMVIPLDDVSEFSPSACLADVEGGQLVHFVPMAAVSENFASIDTAQLRPLHEVRKGYTPFIEGDVLFAKITPCMENGKGGLVPALTHSLAFGSTEFHVLRPNHMVSGEWLSYFLSRPYFRKMARANMTGTAGQMRVPTKWLRAVEINVPPRAEQTRIVDEEIVVSLMRQLSWTHFLVLLPLKDPLSRDFYAQMCTIERWSVRTLRDRVDSMLFERTALSRQPEALIRQELDALRVQADITPALVLKDPYVLDFLGLRDRYLEKDLEDAILRELETFLLELGSGFSFVARQKRIQLDSDDFYIDLLFYNRKLRRLVAIELKLGDFKPEYKGQMELYLRWLAKHDHEPGDAPPLGIILCTGKKQEQIELLELDTSGIHVAEYLSVLPPREAFEQKIHNAMLAARARLDNKANEQ